MIISANLSNITLSSSNGYLYRAPLPVPDLPESLKLFLVYESGVASPYRVDWEAAAVGALSIASGEVQVSVGGLLLCVLQFGKATFPPTMLGSIFPDLPAQQSRYNSGISVKIELDLGEKDGNETKVPSTLLSALLSSLSVASS